MYKEDIFFYLFKWDSARKKWIYIRDAFHLNRKKAATKSGDPAKFLKPYKYVGILEFMILHL